MAANIQFADYAVGQTLGALGTSTTSIQLGSGQGALFPLAGAGLYFYATLVDIATGGLTQHEVVKVTARVGDLLTVVRGGIIDGTPQLWPAGSGIEHRDCAQAMTDLANLVSGGAPLTSTYILQSADASLPNRRILAGSSSINVADGGAGNLITLSIPANAVTNALLAQMPTNTLKGNNTGGPANALDLTVAQVVALLGVPTTAGGVVSISAGSHASRPAFGTVGRVYIETDTLGIFYDTGAAWALVEPALTGDVTTAAGGLATTIAALAVTSGKIANGAVGATQLAAGAVDNTKLAAMNAFTMKGNQTSGSAAPTDMTVAQVQAMTGWNIFNVKSPQYGAVGNGSTDDTAAINAAYTAIGAGGGILYFPAGTYKVTAALTPWVNTMTVMGDGWNASTIATNSATLDVVTISGVVRVTNMRFLPSVARTAGREINITAGGNQVVIDNCFFNGYFNAINVGVGPVGLTIATCQFTNGTAATGIGISFASGTDMLITNIEMDAASGSKPAVGILVSNIGDLTITGCGIAHQVVPLSIAPGNGQTVAQVYAQGCFFDNGGTGMLVQPTGTGGVVRMQFANCWFSSCSSQGIRIIGGGSTTCDGLDFVNSHVILNGSNGVQVDAGAKNVRFIGGEFGQNTGDGLQFNNTDFTVLGIRTGNPGALTGNTNYGVNINNAACNHFLVMGNDLRGNIVGAENNLSTQTDWIMNNNLGDLTSFFAGLGVLSGDWSSATRLMFQTSTVNGQTVVSLRPNGTNTTSILQTWNNSNIAAALAFADMRCGLGAAQFGSYVLNGGAQLPLRLTINGTTAVEIDANLNLKFLKAIADQGYSLQVPLTGFTITVPDNCSCLALNPAGILATGTITMPANPIDGQEVELTTTQTVTALTLNANAGQTISGAVSTLTAISPCKYRYFLSITKWLKVSS